MTWDDYNKLFHKTQANLVAFQPLVQCDHEVIRMIDAAVAEEREACAKVCDDWPNGRDDVYSIGVAIRARGHKL